MTETVTIELEKREEIVKKQHVFSQLTPPEVAVLASIFQEKSFKAGETVVSEGDIVDSIFLIISGRADVRHITQKDGITKIRSLALLAPGQAIGLNESGFYSLIGKRTATVVAITPLVTLYLSIARFHGFALAYPHVNEIMRNNAKTMLNSQ